VIAFKFEGVAGLRQRNAGAALRGQCRSFTFEGQGDVAAFAANGFESIDRSLECIQRHQGLFILKRLASEFGKARLNPRRFAVLNGMAENAIVVHEKVSFSWLAEER
jgi:hypothetical protein